jgi:hypothetical protein
MTNILDIFQIQSLNFWSFKPLGDTITFGNATLDEIKPVLKDSDDENDGGSSGCMGMVGAPLSLPLVSKRGKQNTNNCSTMSVNWLI